MSIGLWLSISQLRPTRRRSKDVSEVTQPVPNGRAESEQLLTISDVDRDGDSVSADGDVEAHILPTKDGSRGRVEDSTSISQLLRNGGISEQGRKRKRRSAEDDIETTYMRRLAKDEAREEQHRQAENSHKRQKRSDEVNTSEADSSVADPDVTPPRKDLAERREVEAQDLPQHETLTPSAEALELEKSARTVFLSNVSTLAIKSKTSKKELLEHLASFLGDLPAGDVQHNVESIRFRSTAFSSTSMPRKAAFAKKELMDTTTKSTNAYAVYSTTLAAREAPKRLNGTIVLGRHLRVDGVAHPARTDNRRCVFVGNLGFVDDESSLRAAEDEQNERKPRKTKQAADVEEGLWRQFSKAGTVESVRVIRDKSTRVGKGIAYVQFLVRSQQCYSVVVTVNPSIGPERCGSGPALQREEIPSAPSTDAACYTCQEHQEDILIYSKREATLQALEQNRAKFWL